MFERIAVRSLLQEKNREAIPADAVVALYTDSYSLYAAKHIAGRLGAVEVHLINTDGGIADIQNRAFLEEVERCHATSATMIIVGPENFWGDGSLANLIAMAGEQSICIAAPHVRVDRDRFIDKLPAGNISNLQLVGIAMQALHPSWVDADASRAETSSFHAGISIRQISATLYSVIHRLPTCWLARFTVEDVVFFRSQPFGRGLWDHAWPQMLVSTERQRVIGSSDAFFIAELTDAETHCVPLKTNDPTQPDAYCRPSLHASVNRNLTAIWRTI